MSSDGAVSSTVATILLVSICVASAAIVLIFAMNVASLSKQRYFVGVRAMRIDSESVQVVYLGGQNSNMLDYLTVKVAQGETCSAACSGGSLGEPDGIAVEAGNASICKCNGASVWSPIRVLVVGHFMGGESQVLVETEV